MPALHQVINLCVKHKNWTVARELLLSEVKATPSARAMILLGRGCLQIDRHEEGRFYLEKALGMEMPASLRMEIERELENL